MADKLATLLRVRRLQADLARTDLARAIAAEHAAAAALDAARAAPQAEARALAPDDAAAFGRWLPRAMAVIAQRHGALQEAANDRARAGTEAACRKAAQDAVAQVASDRKQAARKLALQNAQTCLDEIAGRLHWR